MYLTVKAAPTLAGAVSICSDAGTPATSTDDTYTFTLNPSGGSGTTYTVSGSGITLVLLKTMELHQVIRSILNQWWC
jgi:hypothetical protein